MARGSVCAGRPIEPNLCRRRLRFRSFSPNFFVFPPLRDFSRTKDLEEDSLAFIIFLFFGAFRKNRTCCIFWLPGKRRGLSKMTLAYDYFSFHCDFFIGKPPSSSSSSSLAASSSSSCFDHDALSYKMQFDDEQMMEAYRVPSHYMNSDAILSPDTVS